MSTIVLFNKPFGVLSQFSSQEGQQTLADFIDVPDVYAAGRLDKDSEGLLVLTDDGKLQHQVSSPKYKKPKTYWVQVEGLIDAPALEELRKGVKLKDGMTSPAEANVMTTPDIWPRNPPIRERKNVPTSWLELKIREGRNRQVRRMTAAVGFPTLRLVRYAVAHWTVAGLAPGQYRVIE